MPDVSWQLKMLEPRFAEFASWPHYSLAVSVTLGKSLSLPLDGDNNNISSLLLGLSELVFG